MRWPVGPWVVALAVTVTAASAQQAPAAAPAGPPPRGAFSQASAAVVAHPTLGAAGARKLVDAASAEAARNGWTASIAVVDGGGNLLAFQRLDGATLGTIDVARRKATTALSFGMASADVGRMVSRGGPSMLTLGPDMVAVTGGVPIVRDGVVVGALGVSGGFRGEDDRIVAVALAALER